MTPPTRPPLQDPFREPAVGRLTVATVRDGAFGTELRVSLDGLPEDVARGAGGVRIVGTLRGPSCATATTLPVTAALEPIPGAAVPASRIVLTEPAHWSSDLPHRYRLEARLEGSDTTFGGWIGLRQLGVRGRSFWFEGRRFVLRGVEASGDVPLEIVRDRHRALVCDARSIGTAAALLDRTDREGLFVALRFGPHEAGSLPLRLSRHPSAAFAIATDEAAAAGFLAGMVPSAPLLGLAVDGREPPRTVPAGVAFVVVELASSASLPHERWFTEPPSMPLVAAARPEARDGHDSCDRLQATLAHAAVARLGAVLPWDWAGYLS